MTINTDTGHLFRVTVRDSEDRIAGRFTVAAYTFDDARGIATAWLDDHDTFDLTHDTFTIAAAKSYSTDDTLVVRLPTLARDLKEEVS